MNYNHVWKGKGEQEEKENRSTLRNADYSVYKALAVFAFLAKYSGCHASNAAWFLGSL